MSINKVMITGNLTRDPELKALGSGVEVLNFGVAVNDRRRNKQTGEWEDYPNFVDVAVFGARAAALNRLIFKGSKIAVEGKLRYESWQASDGTHRSRLRVVADDVELMSPRGAAGSSNGGAQATDPAHDPVRNGGHETEPYAKSFSRGGSQQTSAQPVYAAPAPSSRQQAPPPADVYDEDIPF